MSAWDEVEPRDELVLTLAAVGGVIIGAVIVIVGVGVAYARWRWTS